MAGASTLLFKADVQGRGKWQVDTLNDVWFDEEPPLGSMWNPPREIWTR